MSVISEVSAKAFNLLAVLVFSGGQNPCMLIFRSAYEQMVLLHAWTTCWRLV